MRTLGMFSKMALSRRVNASVLTVSLSIFPLLSKLQQILSVGGSWVSLSDNIRSLNQEQLIH